MDARGARALNAYGMVAAVAAMAVSLNVFAEDDADNLAFGHTLLGALAPDTQRCVVCHTPHHAPSSRLLWNHVLSAKNFSWSDWAKTSGGTTLPKNINAWSGSSKLCLSCHDGSVAAGAIYNPQMTFSDMHLGGKWGIGENGDLMGNHPVAIPYPYDGVKNTYNGITTGDEAVRSGWVARPTNVKLYTDPDVQSNNHGIECASCHDPHGTPNVHLLRDSLKGSALCLDCHVK